MPHVRAIFFFVVVFLWSHLSFVLHPLGEKEETTAGRVQRGHTHLQWHKITHIYTLWHTHKLSSSSLHIFPSYHTHTHAERHTLLSFRTHIHTFVIFTFFFLPTHTPSHSHTHTHISSILQREHTLTRSTSHFPLSPPLTHMNTIICRLLSAAGRSCGEESCGRAEDVDNLCRF